MGQIRARRSEGKILEGCTIPRFPWLTSLIESTDNRDALWVYNIFDQTFDILAISTYLCAYPPHKMARVWRDIFRACG